MKHCRLVCAIPGFWRTEAQWISKCRASWLSTGMLAWCTSGSGGRSPVVSPLMTTPPAGAASRGVDLELVVKTGTTDGPSVPTVEPDVRVLDVLWDEQSDWRLATQESSAEIFAEDAHKCLKWRGRGHGRGRGDRPAGSHSGHQCMTTGPSPAQKVSGLHWSCAHSFPS